MTDHPRTRIAAALKLKYFASDDLHNQAADAVIGALGLRVEYGALDDDHGGFLADSPEQLVPMLQGETLQQRLITDWQRADG